MVISFTGISITIINPLLNQFRSLMIPFSSLFFLIHSPFSRIHSDLSLNHPPLSFRSQSFILTIQSPLPYSKVIDKFTTSVHYPFAILSHSLHSITHSLTHSLITHSVFSFHPHIFHILTIQPPIP